MSDQRATKRERSLRFRRRIRQGKAVSPVVATLILILIAVAAAAALYLWLVNWQGGITKGIGSPGAQATLTIGGSTSVYPFDQLAVTQFQQNQTDVVISNNQGGSGAGMLAVCNGAVDIGAASFPVTPSGLVSSYGCSANVANTADVTTVAYDAVDVIVPLANTHGLLSISYDTVALIYADATVVAGGHPSLISTTTAYSAITMNNASLPTTPVIPIPGTVVAGTPSTYLLWDQIPAAVAGAVVNGVTQSAIAAPAEGTLNVVSCGASAPASFDTCYTLGGGAASSTCGWTVCAGGNAAITTLARSDASGTTQSFEARILDAGSSNSFASQATLNSAGSAGFNGCGSSNYISDCGFVATATASGNPAVVSGVAADANSIGYASDGVARSAGSVYLVPFTGVAQSIASDKAATGSPSFGGILPTTGSTGTIANGIKGPSTPSDYYIGYLGWRPFDLVTLTQATGESAAFLTFVLDPANNIALAGEAQEVSIYSV
jgi:flagellin-like protein